MQVDYFRNKLIRNDINLVLLTQNYATNMICVQNGWIKSCESIQSSLSLIYSVCVERRTVILSILNMKFILIGQFFVIVSIERTT